MNRSLELSNIEKPIECCTLEIEMGKLTFYRGDKKTPGFTGLYFKDKNIFFALYPTSNGPVAFYDGKEYFINKNLTITLQKEGKNRKFKIKEYDISIDYIESPYIGFDSWSDEIDVDLFYMIEQNYLEPSFYEKYTLNVWIGIKRKLFVQNKIYNSELNYQMFIFSIGFDNSVEGIYVFTNEKDIIIHRLAPWI